MSIMISTTVDIDAPPEAVWDVLTDFAAYGEWNPFTRIEGTAQAGTRLIVHMAANGGHGMAFNPRSRLRHRAANCDGSAGSVSVGSSTASTSLFSPPTPTGAPT